jgi:Protein of unknown function (DUF3828)
MTFFPANRIAIALAALSLFATGCHNDPPPPPPQVAPVPTVTANVNDEQSCRLFVQNFYDWYFNELNHPQKQPASTQKGAPVLDEVQRLRPELLSTELHLMLREDAAASAKSPDDIVGLDFDPYINAQDWDQKYQLGDAKQQDGHCRVTLWDHEPGKSHKAVEPELVPANGNWLFVNFHYFNDKNGPDGDLIRVLNALKQERDHPTPTPSPKK